MGYQAKKNTLEKMMKENYRDCVKAFISIETGIEDEEILETLYTSFMENDEMRLLSEEFDILKEETK